METKTVLIHGEFILLEKRFCIQSSCKNHFWVRPNVEQYICQDFCGYKIAEEKGSRAKGAIQHGRRNKNSYAVTLKAQKYRYPDSKKLHALLGIEESGFLPVRKTAR